MGITSIAIRTAAGEATLSVDLTDPAGVAAIRQLLGLGDSDLVSQPPPYSPAPTTSRTLAALLIAFMETIPVKESTKLTYEQTRQSLLDYFGVERTLETITALEAERWRAWMKSDDGRRRGGGGLSAATISKRIKTARQIFKQAVRWKMASENPFLDMKAGQQRNRSRMRFVSIEEIERVLAACPDETWRTIVALARYGGLRCSSEVERLRFSDLDWERGRMLVRSSKTEGNALGGERMVPIYPELRPYLLAALEAAPAGAIYVVDPTRLRGTRRKNLGTGMKRIIIAAGLTPWPRTFQNLRSSRQTELCQRFPSHVVAAWQGNSEVTAREHYLQVVDRDFEAALVASA